MVLFIFLLLMISFIQIQPVQKTIDEIVEIWQLENVNSFSTITGKKLMQPIKYKHVLCFVFRIYQYINITICWNVCTQCTFNQTCK
jgi:hypothetical protein